MEIDNSVSIWPTLGDISHPMDRIGFIGGSDANAILSRNADRIDRLWREKRGEVLSEDLTGVLPVMLGTWTENFNRQWFECVTGQTVSPSDHTLSCSTYAWRTCNLDGFIEDRGAVWEAKHTGAFTKSDEVLERYMPQLQHNMAVAKSDLAVLSVIFGNHKFEIFEVASDWLYQLDLLEAEEDFWDCVQTGRVPVAISPPIPPRPVGVREVCLEGNNSWAAAAADWAQNREPARIYADACSQIKQLIEPDVSRAFGHGIEARRSKAGAISIREMAS
ncbi:MAG: YqaJ viral recombinase family protein [Pseudomonadota bacterium]